MLNGLWPGIIIISFIYGILSGKTNEINESIFRSAKDAVELSINLLRNNMLVEWNNANCFKNKHGGKTNKIFKTNYEIFIS